MCSAQRFPSLRLGRTPPTQVELAAGDADLIYNPGMQDRRVDVPQGHRRFPGRMLVVAALIAVAAGCGGPPLDPSTTLAVTDVTTGWLDVGVDELGRNKLVPTISFRLENVSQGRVRTLQLSGVFRRCLPVYEGQPMPASEVSPPNSGMGTCAGEPQEWGNAFVKSAVGREGLEPGMGTTQFTMQSGLGYTGEQPRLDMLQHGDFVDAKVELFIKHRADDWVMLNEYQIERQLLTQ